MLNYKPVDYMERTRLYYEAQGFDQPYRWANFEDVPFQKLLKPLSDSRIVLITTGAQYDRSDEDPRFVDSGNVLDPPARLWADDLAWDKQATHMNDLDSYLPIRAVQAMVREGMIGSLAERFHCLPTEYSQRRTREVDAPEILRRCREDGADIALLIPL